MLKGLGRGTMALALRDEALALTTSLINSELNTEQQADIREILNEYQDIFSDVPKVMNLIEHKVQLTETEPENHKSYPIPYKMQKDIDKEIDDMLAMGVI